MNLIDTHCHLYSEEFDADRDAMIQRALAVGVSRFYLPAIDSEAIPGMLALEAQYPGVCIAMMGLHPCYVKANYREELAIVEEWLAKKPFVAVARLVWIFIGTEPLPPNSLKLSTCKCSGR